MIKANKNKLKEFLVLGLFFKEIRRFTSLLVNFEHESNVFDRFYQSGTLLRGGSVTTEQAS